VREIRENYSFGSFAGIFYNSYSNPRNCEEADRNEEIMGSSL
jgi:hypothetical protein